LYEVLLEVLREDGQDVKGIYERNDIRVRAKEGLPLEKGYWKQMKLPTTTIIDENGLKLHVDVENGQKTGYFLDQKANRVL
ncbi:rRNA large subunit methyltransferase I, partial [Flavonifractor plautii]|nr:rRNA large subunit methyltransferase I [Flavonifractor plautii]